MPSLGLFRSYNPLLEIVNTISFSIYGVLVYVSAYVSSVDQALPRKEFRRALDIFSSASIKTRSLIHQDNVQEKTRYHDQGCINIFLIRTVCCLLICIETVCCMKYVRKSS